MMNNRNIYGQVLTPTTYVNKPQQCMDTAIKYVNMFNAWVNVVLYSFIIRNVVSKLLKRSSQCLPLKLLVNMALKLYHLIFYNFTSIRSTLFRPCLQTFQELFRFCSPSVQYSIMLCRTSPCVLYAQMVQPVAVEFCTFLPQRHVMLFDMIYDQYDP